MKAVLFLTLAFCLIAISYAHTRIKSRAEVRLSHLATTPVVTITGYTVDKLLGKGGNAAAYAVTKGISVKKHFAARSSMPGTEDITEPQKEYDIAKKVGDKVGDDTTIKVDGAGPVKGTCIDGNGEATAKQGCYWVVMTNAGSQTLEKCIKAATEAKKVGFLLQKALDLLKAYWAKGFIHNDYQLKNIAMAEDCNSGSMRIIDLDLTTQTPEATHNYFRDLGKLIGSEHTYSGAYNISEMVNAAVKSKANDFFTKAEAKLKDKAANTDKASAVTTLGEMRTLVDDVFLKTQH